jgi:hypothetical protein
MQQQSDGRRDQIEIVLLSIIEIEGLMSIEHLFPSQWIRSCLNKDSFYFCFIHYLY